MSKFNYYYPVEVRFGDLDTLRHVNNARYLTYYEQARLKYLVVTGIWDGVSFDKMRFVMADAQIAFLVPIHFGQTVNIGVRVSRLGNKSMVIEEQMEDIKTGEVLSTCEIVYVAFDPLAQKSIPLAGDIRHKIKAYEGYVL